MKNIVEYLRRNLARIFDVAESVVKVVEKVANALVELVPLTKTTKDDQVVATIRNVVGPVRKGLDKVRDFLYGPQGV